MVGASVLGQEAVCRRKRLLGKGPWVEAAQGLCTSGIGEAKGGAIMCTNNESLAASAGAGNQRWDEGQSGLERTLVELGLVGECEEAGVSLLLATGSVQIK